VQVQHPVAMAVIGRLRSFPGKDLWAGCNRRTAVCTRADHCGNTKVAEVGSTVVVEKHV